MEFTFITTTDKKTEQYENPLSMQGEIRTIQRRNAEIGKMHRPVDCTLEKEEDAATELQ